MEVPQAVQQAPSGSREGPAASRELLVAPSPEVPTRHAEVLRASREAPTGSPAAVQRSRTVPANSLKVRQAPSWELTALAMDAAVPSKERLARWMNVPSY